MMDKSWLQVVYILLFLSVIASKKLWGKDSLNIGYDFEKLSDIKNIKTQHDAIELDNKIQKHGKNSLLWKWKVNQVLRIDLTPQRNMLIKTKRICGLHFWIHQSRPIKSHLRLTFINKKGERFAFRVYLYFQNWRAVARTFAITGLRQFEEAETVLLEVEDNDPFIQSGNMNLDLIRLSSRCVGWTYDYVNTPQIAMPYGTRNEIGGIEDLNGIYEINNFWQSMYKWRKIDVFKNSKTDSITPLTKEENQLTKELNKIEKRIDNWYFSNDKHFENLSPIATKKLDSLQHCTDGKSDVKSKTGFLEWLNSAREGNFAYKRRKAFASLDNDHEVCFDSAYEKLQMFKQNKRWPSLFPSRDVLPHGHENWTGLKFNEVTGRIIFPLALEYFISKRRSQRKHSIGKALQSEQHLQEVINDELHSNFTTSQLVNLVGEKKDIFKIFKSVDNRKLSMLRKLLKYINSEGWDDGSGLGNTDHLINLNAGFTHALYLLRKDLKNSRLFRKLINTARWYNEMGELHQENYSHNGSTADKIRFLMLNRLLLTIASPYSSIKEARKKVNDAKNLKRWIENSLKVNQGYGGIIKPDYTGYHHKGVYMAAYIPPALHALSLAAYFLHGTPFAIHTKYLTNLKNALMTVYRISNGNSVPISVSGAKPGDSVNNIYNTLPAFAYLSIAMGSNSVSVHPELASVFMKLYKPVDETVQIELINGKPSRKNHQYFNSVGSIHVFEKVYKLAKTESIVESLSTQGHWVYSYAGLNVHRRKEWTVSVKGFNKYIWDYESTVDQNVFGRYQSHGYLSLANGMKSLESHDYFHGWDWNKIPGATTVELQLNQLQSAEKCRYFSNKTMVGGLVFGKRKSKNGLFAMDFNQPKYFDKFYLENPHDFSFKKSFFFFDDMIIALGSNIRKVGLHEKKVITTLFQNKLKNEESNIIINGKTVNKNQIINKYVDQFQPITFVDANNNGYFIPVNRNNKVNVKVGKDKLSKKPNGLPVTNPETYASVTINHGSEPQNEKYEYVILVNSGKDKIEEFKLQMSPWMFGYKPYYILQQDEVAHIIQIRNMRYKITSYVIFNAEQFVGNQIEHFINRVSRPCLIVVKETTNHMHLSVSDPDLRMFDDYLLYSKLIGKEMLYKAYSKADWIKLTFNKFMKLHSTKNSNKTLLDSISPIYKERDEHGLIKPRIKMLMSHGLTTDLKFRK